LLFKKKKNERTLRRARINKAIWLCVENGKNSINRRQARWIE
jgi:hypothetical protein